VQGCWMHVLMGCAKDWKWSKCIGQCLPFCILFHAILFNSILFYSTLIITVYLSLMGLSS
jgi:hypothetical protein